VWFFSLHWRLWLGVTVRLILVFSTISSFWIVQIADLIPTMASSGFVAARLDPRSLSHSLFLAIFSLALHRREFASVANDSLGQQNDVGVILLVPKSQSSRLRFWCKKVPWNERDAPGFVETFCVRGESNVLSFAVPSIVPS
jgi:hypothetical protein